MKEIEVYGKTYPVRVTMGALRRYKRETGEEISRMGNVSDKLVTFLYCCTASACNAEKVEFDLDIDTFADGIDISVMNEFANEFGEASSEGEAKKVEPVDIDDLVGMALGGMGMSLSDFEACTPNEFEAAFRCWEQNHCQEAWERARFMACCMLQPYSKNALKAEDVCRFPWDSQRQTADPAEGSTRERFEELVRRMEKNQ